MQTLDIRCNKLVFKNEKSGIILEDDIIPSSDFLNYVIMGLKNMKIAKK